MQMPPSARLGLALQKKPSVLAMVQKFRNFLKDESATAPIEFVVLGAGIAVAIITALKPANASPACRTCGRPTRLVTAISKFRRHPELRFYECDQCRETAVEEWRPRENAGRQLPNSRQGARTLAAGLMVLRKEWGIRSLDIALILGIWAGSIAFGWKQQPFWLAVPPVVCIAYTVFLIRRHSTWAATGRGLGRRKIYEMWMSGKAAGLALLPFLGSWRWVGVGGRSQKSQDEFSRRDLALETVCPEQPLLFSAGQMKLLP
jgi:Flp pilus assembly pilin Flp